MKMKESEPVVVKKTSLGNLTTSVEGLRYVAKYLEEKGIKGNFITEHFIVRYSDNTVTIGIGVDNEVVARPSTSENSESTGSTPTRKDTETSGSEKTT